MSSVIISAKGARKILEQTLPFDGPIDIHLNAHR
jgi:hypothetical protein